MNWKIIFQLSFFGLIMAIGTVFLIPLMVEPVFWLAIFTVSAIVIVRACPGRYFLHGFLTSMANCVWIIAAHSVFYSTYMKNHPELAKYQLSIASHPRASMIVTGIAVGIICGIILGLFAFIASKIISGKGVMAPGGAAVTKGQKATKKQ